MIRRGTFNLQHDELLAHATRCSYLLQRAKHEEATRALQFFYGCSALEADAHMRELRRSLQDNLAPMSLLEVARNKDTRRPTIVGSMTAVAMSFSGVAGETSKSAFDLSHALTIAVINAFAVEILRNTGLTVAQASLANVGLSVLTLVSDMRALA